MEGLTDFITQYRWVDIFTVWFVLIDDAHQVLQDHFGDWRKRGTAPIFSDAEVITVALIADTFFAGREDKTLSFIRQYHSDLFPTLPSCGRFNTRRRALNMITEEVRRVIVKQWGLMEDENGQYMTHRLTDSAPIPVCTYTRAKLSRTIEQTLEPRDLYFGVCASKKTKVFGFRLHMDTSLDQVVDRWMLAPACVHDSRGLTGMYEDESLTRGAVYDLMVLGDGAFNNPSWLASMRYKHGRGVQGVQLLAIPRTDSRTPWSSEFRRLVSKVRRRIETAFSVLNVVFSLEQPASKSLSGLVSRVSTRILAYTLAFITGPLLAFLGFHTQN